VQITWGSDTVSDEKVMNDKVGEQNLRASRQRRLIHEVLEPDVESDLMELMSLIDSVVTCHVLLRRFNLHTIMKQNIYCYDALHVEILRDQ